MNGSMSVITGINVYASNRTGVEMEEEKKLGVRLLSAPLAHFTLKEQTGITNEEVTTLPVTACDRWMALSAVWKKTEDGEALTSLYRSSSWTKVRW